MNKLDKKQISGNPENWDGLKPETLLFATEVCMMNRDTKALKIGGSDGFGGLAGTILGFVIVVMLLTFFQALDTIQTPNQATYRNQNPWKLNRIKPITAVNIGPATQPKPVVVAAPAKPPVPSSPPPKPKQTVAEAATKAEELAKTEAAAKAEKQAKAEAAAKAEEQAKTEAAAKAEEQAKAEAAAKAEEQAKTEAATKAEEQAKAEAAVKAEEQAKAEVAAKAEASATINNEADILNVVTNWVNAWSGQQVDIYINSYTSDFKPQQYKSHQYWADQRRKRLSRPSSINIQLSNVQVRLTEDGNATVTFVQIYKSPSFTDQVRKTLVLKQESGSWKISSETAKQL